MSGDSRIFELICHELENATSLTQLEARGTIRLALKEAGLEAGSVAVAEMSIVLEKILPGELAARGIREPGLPLRLQEALQGADEDEATATSAADIFRHLGGDR